MEDRVRLTITDGVAEVRLNRAAKMNALDPAMFQAIAEAGARLDAPSASPESMDALKEAARSERLLPGEGQLDLAGMLSRLPIDLPISVEIPNSQRLRAVGAEEWARRALDAARRVVEGPRGGLRSA
jgi:hypothetical protein